MVLQLLRVLAPVRIVAADVDDTKLGRLKAGQITGRAVLVPDAA
jgi:hypothetical protein